MQILQESSWPDIPVLTADHMGGGHLANYLRASSIYCSADGPGDVSSRLTDLGKGLYSTAGGTGATWGAVHRDDPGGHSRK